MKILVLGATGQIGYALTERLARSEHQVSILIRNRGDLKFSDKVAVTERPEFTLEAFKAALEGVDHVVYGIGPPEQFMFDASVFEKVNCGLLGTFLQAMQASRVRRMTYLSTYEVFEIVNGAAKETHKIVTDESRMTAYSQSKIRAYRLVTDFSRQNGIALTTLHPAAVFGGLDTGDGLTSYLEKLMSWKVWRLPFIPTSQFPLMHIDSLVDATIASFDAPGAFILSDQMTSLHELSLALRRQTPCYVPLVMPLPIVKFGVFMMEAFAKIVPIKPLISSVQIHFLTRGWEPIPAKAIAQLGFMPMKLDEGLRRFLRDRKVVAAPKAQPVLKPAMG